MSIARSTEILENSHDKVNGGIDVNIQSQTSPLFGYYLMRTLDDELSLASAAIEDAETVTLIAGHGFTGAAGEHILLYENDHFLQQEVTASQISGNVITLVSPVDVAFTTDAVVIRGNINLNVNFASSPETVDFTILDGVTPIDLSAVILTFQSSTDPDDGSFGGISELTNGVYFRQIDGRRINLGNYKKNLDFRARKGTIEYSDKAPSTDYATTVIFDIESAFGQVLRIDPQEGCCFNANLRDDLSGLSLFNISLTGSYTSGES